MGISIYLGNTNNIINYAQTLSGKTNKSVLNSFLMHSSLLCFSMPNVPNVPGSTVAAQSEIYLKPESK